MTRIGLLSDTHGYLDPAVFRHFETCDEIWHAGDFGNLNLVKDLGDFKPLRGVYGNIDTPELRHEYPEQLVFDCEKVKVMMRHIGGSPPRYNPETRKQIQEHRPLLFICGHSHILKIMYDTSFQCLYMNPGAAGKQGWHKIKTLLRFVVDGAEINDCEVIELGKK